MKALAEWTAEEKRTLIRKQGGDKAHLLNILLELQKQSGQNYIDEETAELVAETVGIGQAQLYGQIHKRIPYDEIHLSLS